MNFSWRNVPDRMLGSLPTHIDGFKAGKGQWLPGPKRSYSAVCILFLPASQEKLASQILFIRRSLNLNSHRGQIALPGGHADTEDLSPADTALRELFEEVGVAPDQVQIAGTLPPVQSLEQQIVVPVLACSSIAFDSLVINPAEVSYVFQEPWTSFRAERNKPFSFKIFGKDRQSEFFTTSSAANNIWGLTALILYRANFQ